MGKLQHPPGFERYPVGKIEIKKQGGYAYVINDGYVVASVNPKGKMSGYTKYFKYFGKRKIREMV